MKKNLKFVSAAAAALLTVAPVVASTTAPVFAADAPAKPETTQATELEATNATQWVKAGAAVNSVQVNPTMTVGSVVAGTTKVIKASTPAGDNQGSPVALTDTLEAGSSYSIGAVVAVSGLKPGQTYSYTTYNSTTKQLEKTSKQASSDGVIGAVYVVINVRAYDSNAADMPFFTNASSNNTITNGGQASAVVNEAIDNKGQKYAIHSVNTVLAEAEKVVKANNGEIITTIADIKAQLANEGISVNNGGGFNATAPYYITLTAKNYTSGKTATVVIAFNTAISNDDYPIIGYMAQSGKVFAPLQQGDKTLGTYPAQQVAQGTKNYNPVKLFKAEVSSQYKNSFTDILVTSNNVNTDVPGMYSVTVKATNPAGKTTSFTFPVYVTNGQGIYQTVNYVPGYSVLVWNIYGDKVAYNNNGYSKQMAGTQVKTFDTKTVNGVSYTRIGDKKTNTWIQTQYLDGSWSQNSNSSSNSSAQAGKEEAMSGVIVVKYNGLGGVNLLNNKGQYQDQYVTNGHAFKVFGKMTLNGKTYYRLGTQNQWIPAQYAVIR